MNCETTRLIRCPSWPAPPWSRWRPVRHGPPTGRWVEVADPYFVEFQDILKQALAAQPNTNRAKNVILFVGDGMGDLDRDRGADFEGPQRGVDGVSKKLAFDAFPHGTLSKTYSSDAQVTDSAPSATAMMTGVKLKKRHAGGQRDVQTTTTAPAPWPARSRRRWKWPSWPECRPGRSPPPGSLTPLRPPPTPTRRAVRDWEADGDMKPEAIAAGCTDIARQLVEMSAPATASRSPRAAGAQRFLPDTMEDPEDAGKKGKRKDGKDLTQAWLQRYGNSGAYVWNEKQFSELKPENVDHLLGLFERSHMEYEYDREKAPVASRPWRR